MSQAEGIVCEVVRIEARTDAEEDLMGTLHYAENAGAGAGSPPPVLLLPPHPNFGGDRNNRFLRILAATLAASGRVCLSFDYHGVGGSTARLLKDETVIDHWHRVEAEGDHAASIRDARHAFEYLCGAVPGAATAVVAAYSYGCVVDSLGLRERTDISARAWIAPPYPRFALAPPPSDVPFLTLSGSEDFLYDEEQAEGLCADGSATRLVQQDADHFFRGCEAPTAERIRAWLDLC